jgi:hypothetical protein
VSRARADVHPEHRVRWLDIDQDLDAFLRGLELRGEETLGKTKASNDVESDVETDVETMSTRISIPDSNDFGDYMFGLPNIEKLRTWEEVVDSDKEAVLEDVPRTQQFFRRLCFRLGKTIHDLREKREVYRRQLTRDQREDNRQFVHEVTRLWHLDAEQKAFIKSEDPPPKEEDIVEMATQEKFAYSKDHHMDVIRKGIIREAYENKSMLFPNRIYRHVGDKGKMIEAPRRREPVWSFAHPERKGKAQRYWDINRWPVHLRSEETAANIRSSGPQDPSRPRRRSTKEPKVSFSSPFSPLEPQPQPQPQGEQETQSTAKASSPDITEEMDTEVDASESLIQTIPGLGEKFAVTFDDLADSRRTFTPGPPQYFLGDTPLQKQAIENFVKSGKLYHPISKYLMLTACSRY